MRLRRHHDECRDEAYVREGHPYQAKPLTKDELVALVAELSRARTVWGVFTDDGELWVIATHPEFRAPLSKVCAAALNLSASLNEKRQQ